MLARQMMRTWGGMRMAGVGQKAMRFSPRMAASSPSLALRRMCSAPKHTPVKPRARKTVGESPSPPTRMKNVLLTAGVLGVGGAITYYLVTEWDSVIALLQGGGAPDKSLMREALPSAQANVITVIIALEGTLLARSWDPKYGFRYEMRDGMEEFILDLVTQGYEVIFWCDNTLQTGMELFGKLMSAVPVLPFRGILAREHMYPGEGGKRIKLIKDLPRNLNNVVLIDHDPDTMKNQEDNVIVVPKMDPEKEDQADKTLIVLKKFFETFSRDYRKGEVPDMRTFIRRYRGAPGVGSGENMTNILSNITADMEERLKEEHLRETTGLGGMVRRWKSSSKLLKAGKLATPTSGTMEEVPKGSLLEQKMAKMRREAQERRRQFEEKQRGNA